MESMVAVANTITPQPEKNMGLRASGAFEAVFFCKFCYPQVGSDRIHASGGFDPVVKSFIPKNLKKKRT
jgi:hypothetical protein